MDFKMKKILKDKARYAYGLINVLEWDVDILRKDINDYDLDKIKESVRDTDETLQKLILLVDELEYILKLDKNA